jgi:hypothetical protein
MNKSSENVCHVGCYRTLSGICTNARWTFRKSVWLSAAKLALENSQTGMHSDKGNNGGDIHDSSRVDRDKAFQLLEYANWNIVQEAYHTVSSSPRASCDTIVLSPVCVVMLHVDMNNASGLTWSEKFIETIVRDGAIYGTVDTYTHIVIQIFFKRIGADETVSVIVADKGGMAYCYNLPGGDCQQLALRLVSTVLHLVVGAQVSMLHKIVPYQQRTYYDDCLFVMFITASCATASSLSAIQNANAPILDLGNCRPSVRHVRPTRIIANLRFLMFLCNPTSRTIVDDLLLDEVNILDSFRALVIKSV